MKFLAEHIHIVGLGLIGGSMALGLRDHDYRLTGWDQNKDHRNYADDRGFVEEILAPRDLTDSPRGIILATPVPVMPKVVRELQTYVSPEFYTDVGSTKSWLLSRLEDELTDEIPFVGAHPMAGSEQSGPRGADPLLFENAICVLTPKASSSGVLEQVRKLWEELGAIVPEMDPLRHDRVASRVSHLPHIAAACLVHALSELDGYKQDALGLAAGGFRDTTRIAEGEPNLWRDIIHTNRESIVESIETYESLLRRIKSVLSSGDPERVEQFLREARSIRREIPEKAKGMIGKLHELRIQAPDRPGVLAEITGAIANEKINIIDIEVLKVREGEMGTIKLAFRDEHSLKSARECLKSDNTDIQII